MRRSILLALGLALAPLVAVAQQVGFNQRAAVSVAASGDNTVVAAQAGKRISVWGIDLALASSGALKLKCGSTDLTGAMTLTYYSKQLTANAAYWVCNPGDAFIVNLGGAIQTSGAIWYSVQ